ncbi:unnamed protein product [Gordionus sp. m RMFG-2023]|uniref:beclin-1-like protein A n=1 Tax=Gordionus sp. m RMFG-2023 TaxID=3053472 RepID=UPI0030E512C6
MKSNYNDNHRLLQSKLYSNHNHLVNNKVKEYSKKSQSLAEEPLLSLPCKNYGKESKNSNKTTNHTRNTDFRENNGSIILSPVDNEYPRFNKAKSKPSRSKCSNENDNNTNKFNIDHHYNKYGSDIYIIDNDNSNDKDKNNRDYQERRAIILNHKNNLSKDYLSENYVHINKNKKISEERNHIIVDEVNQSPRNSLIKSNLIKDLNGFGKKYNNNDNSYNPEYSYKSQWVDNNTCITANTSYCNLENWYGEEETNVADNISKWRSKTAHKIFPNNEIGKSNCKEKWIFEYLDTWPVSTQHNFKEIDRTPIFLKFLFYMKIISLKICCLIIIVFSLISPIMFIAVPSTLSYIRINNMIGVSNVTISSDALNWTNLLNETKFKTSRASNSNQTISKNDNKLDDKSSNTSLRRIEKLRKNIDTYIRKNYRNKYMRRKFHNKINNKRRHMEYVTNHENNDGINTFYIEPRDNQEIFSNQRHLPPINTKYLIMDHYHVCSYSKFKLWKSRMCASLFSQCNVSCQGELTFLLVKIIIIVFLTWKINSKYSCLKNSQLNAKNTVDNHDKPNLLNKFIYIFHFAPSQNANNRFILPYRSSLSYIRLSLLLVLVCYITFYWVFFATKILLPILSEYPSIIDHQHQINNITEEYDNDAYYKFDDIVKYSDSFTNCLILIYVLFSILIIFNSETWDHDNIMFSAKCTRAFDGISKIYHLPSCSIQKAAMLLLDFYHKDYPYHDPYRYSDNTKLMTNKINEEIKNVTLENQNNIRKINIDLRKDLIRNNDNKKVHEKYISKSYLNSKGSASEILPSEIKHHQKYFDFETLNSRNKCLNPIIDSHSKDAIKCDLYENNNPQSVYNLNSRINCHDINNSRQYIHNVNHCTVKNNNKNLGKSRLNDDKLCEQTTSKEKILFKRDKKISSPICHNKRFYDEEDYELKVKRRRARLITSAEEAFNNFDRVSKESLNSLSNRQSMVINVSSSNTHAQKKLLGVEENKMIMKVEEIAQAIFPSLVKNMHKFIRLTKQQSFYNINMILEHLAKFIKYDMGPYSFVDQYINPVNTIHNERLNQALQDWIVICEQPLTSTLKDSTIFQLRKDSMKLFIEVKCMPKYILHEHILNPNLDNFYYTIDSKIIV